MLDANLTFTSPGVATGVSETAAATAATKTKNTNSLSNLNSIKSKKFQMYTRKLLEIALEMLLKCQVPSVQYISLTTINRIFDIYVYHNLFYPGFYESCYIPLSKRQMNRMQQQNLHEANLLKASANLNMKNIDDNNTNHNASVKSIKKK